MKTDIIITDDHRLFADGLANILSTVKHYNILPVAPNAKVLLSMMQKKPAELVLLDMSMPGMNGLDACKELFRLYPEVKVLMVTMNDDPAVLKEMIHAGVHGIILKNTGKTELLTAISEVLRDHKYFSVSITRQLASGVVSQPGTNWELTKREKDVLQLIYEGYTSVEIAEKLNLSVYTVETHRKGMLKKSGLNKSSQLVKVAQELGYLKR